MKTRFAVGLLFGAVTLAATLYYAGPIVCVRTLADLGVLGLLILVMVHLPIEGVLGVAWYSVAGDSPGVGWRRFVWARFVRDAAGELLPFSQIGGFVLGTRALRLPGALAVRGVLSTVIDLLMELAAKVPYVLIGVVVLLSVAPRSGLMRQLGLGIGLSVLGIAAALLVRRRLTVAVGSLVGRISSSTRFLAALKPRLADDAFDCEAQRMIQQSGLRLAFVLHLCCWLMGAVEVWLVFALLGRPVTGVQALLIDSAVVGLRTFAFWVPAAAGVQEASYALACALFGIPPATAVAASLARRARDLALGTATFAIATWLDARHPRDTNLEAAGSRDTPRSEPRGL